MKRFTLFLRVSLCVAWGILCLSAPLKGADEIFESDEEYILIVNSYSEAVSWSDHIINTVMSDLLANGCRMKVSIQHMNMLQIDDMQTLDRFKQRFFSMYRRAPRLLIYVGDSSWGLMHGELMNRWPDSYVLFFPERDFSGPIEYYLTKQAIPEPLHVSLQEYAWDDATTVVQIPLCIQRTIALMKRVMPNMDELVYVSDQRWISAQNRAETERIVRLNYPDVTLRFFTAGEIGTGQLLDSLQSLGPHSGVLYDSWISKDTIPESGTISTSLFRVVASYTRRPVFTLRGSDMPGSGMMGGYFPTVSQIADVTAPLIGSIVRDGYVRDFSVPQIIRADASPVINYPLMATHGISMGDLPRGVILVDKPLTFVERNAYWLTGGACLLFACALSLWLFSRRRRQDRKMRLVMNYRNLFDNMPIAYAKLRIVSDKEGSCTDYIVEEGNPAFKNVFEKEYPIIGRRGSELPNGNVSGIRDAYSRFRKGAGERVVTTQFYNPDNEKMYNVIVIASHVPNVIDVFLVDTTELYQTQQKLSMVNHKLALSLEAADIMPWRWDLEQHTLVCDVNRSEENPESLQAGTLVMSEEEYYANIHKKDRDRVKESVRKLLDGELSRIHGEYRILLKIGGRHRFQWVEVQAVVDHRDSQGKPLSLIGSMIIVSRRKEIEAALLSAKEKAEESNRLKSAFLANMSHEIRTPLNAIVGFSNVLATADSFEEKEEYVRIIENNNTLLLQLINDILDLSKIEAGTLEFSYADTDLQKLLDETVRTVRLRVDNADVAVSLEECPALRACIDKNRVSQVLMNLATNAIKFTPKGSIRLGCRLRENAREFYFYVQDTGCGIPKEKQQAIFERFIKLNSFAQGTGLGLSICRTIVTHMGGRIGVESKVGKGSLFWFTLPFKPAQGQLPEEKSEEPLPVEKTRLKVLVAEDNSDNFKLFESILRKDYDILHAWDGQQAVELFRAHHPHIVLMDINMPVMNGYDATAQIRESSARVPIIAVTAYAFASDEERIMQSGFDAYVAKPLNAGQLRTKMTDLLKKYLLFI